MTDRRAVSDPDETPEDVASLYSWANLHGGRYRDFSASRAEWRAAARQRVQEAMEAERRRAMDAIAAANAARGFDGRDALIQSRENAERAERAQLAAQQAAWQAAQYAQGHPQQAPYPAGYSAAPAQPYPNSAPAQGRDLQQTGWSGETRETGSLPAWLATERGELSGAPLAQAPENTLQGTRDRLASRWFALKGLFAQAPAQPEPVPAESPSRAPVLAVFSLAGGAGKTSLVATLGRALSARGERVLLADTSVYGLLPFFFGAREQRPGVLRTFTPPGNSGDAPIQMLTLDPETLGPENAPQETLALELSRGSSNASRIVIDVATASATITRRVLRMGPTVLVPLLPDMSSVVSVSSIDAFFQRNAGTPGQAVLPFYVLNQFDPSLPLHLDVREVLREQLGERLLPFSLRRAPAVSEALAEGMTVVDYAPNSTVAEDFGALAGWVKSLAAPASLSFRGVRWSER
jgi:cellulose synthase operon protein YhjQ